MSKIHYELLSKEQREVLEILRSFSKYGVLGGGTALMLQLFHRYSYDFDVFTPKAISRKFLYKIKQHFKKIDIITDTGDELSFVSVPQRVKISFIYYPFSPLYKIISTPFPACLL